MRLFKIIDIILIIILLTAAVCFYFLSTGKTDSGGYVDIYAENTHIGKYDLQKPARITNNGAVIIIDGSYAYIETADCPNKLCTHGRISRPGQMLVCLPNRVFAVISGSGVDGVTR